MHGGEEECIVKFGWKNHKESDSYEDLDIGGRVIWKWILER
jgi:hypothetical protein